MAQLSAPDVVTQAIGLGWVQCACCVRLDMMMLHCMRASIPCILLQPSSWMASNIATWYGSILRKCYTVTLGHVQDTHWVLTELGHHEQGDEGEVLVGDEAAGCSIKLQHCLVVAGEYGVEEARRDGQQRHELHQNSNLCSSLPWPVPIACRAPAYR